MGKILAIILVLIFCIIIIALPLYFCVNLVCLVFQLPFHLTLLQAIALSLLASVIHKLLFKKRKDE